MKDPIGIGLAVAATASFALAHGDDDSHKGGALADGLFQRQPEITYTAGQGLQFDGGDDYCITLGGRLSPEYYYTSQENSQSISSFGVRDARLFTFGRMFSKDLTFLLQADFADVTSVLDAWVSWRVHSGDDAELGVRLGLGKWHASRQFDAEDGGLEFTQRALATRTFSGTRETGFAVEGSAMPAEDGSNTLFYYLGAVNNDLAAGSGGATGGAAPNSGNELDWIAGVRFDPMGDMGDLRYREGDLEHTGHERASVSVNVMVGNETVSGFQVETTQWNVGAAFKSGNGVHVEGEAFLRNDEDQASGAEADSGGWYVQASVTTSPATAQYGLAVRYGQVKIDDPGVMTTSPMRPSTGDPLGGATGTVTEFEVAIDAYHHKHWLKTQLGYTYQDVSPDGGGGATNQLIDLRFTIYF